MSDRSVDEWKRVLRAALGDALRARQMHAVAVFRETLAAIDNAEAVTGPATGEVPRRVLTPDEVDAIVERELAERRDAAAMYETLGKNDEARTLNLQIDVLLALR